MENFSPNTIALPETLNEWGGPAGSTIQVYNVNDPEWPQRNNTLENLSQLRFFEMLNKASLAAEI